VSTQAFGPRGNTANISCTDSASTAVQVSSLPNNQFTYQFINSGSNKVYFAYSTQPNVVAVIPTPSTPANGVCVLPNEIVIYNLLPNCYISAICESGGTTNLLVTPGEGM
jgi:hypothetical protein